MVFLNRQFLQGFHSPCPIQLTQNLLYPGQANESFADILKQFEKNRTAKPVEGSREATVISISADSVVLDIGFKTEGVLPMAELGKDAEGL